MTGHKIGILIAIGSVLFGITGAAFAFGLPSFGKSSQSSDATGMQTKLVADFVTGQNSVLTSQSDIAQALGLKDVAAKLKADAAALNATATNNKGDLERNVGESENASAQIAKTMAQAKPLSAQAHADMQKAIPEYLTSVAQLTKLRPDYQNFIKVAQQQISSSPMSALTLKTKLADGMYIAQSGPGYTDSLVKTASDFITYAKGNNISIPKNASDLIGSPM